MLIRPATPDDANALWGILEPVIRAGETNALPLDMPREAALAYWHSPGAEVFIAEEDGHLLGTCMVRANQMGPGAHVANAGYITARQATGRGVARRLCEHSLETARARGFRAMQFNLVVSTNAAAVHLWQSCGFAIVGRLPGAFEHPSLGFVDALVMYRTLQMPLAIEPVTLAGRHVVLAPLSPAHLPGLIEAARDGELWRLWYTSAPSPDEMPAEIDRRLALQGAGSMLPFTVISQPDGRIAGMTTYMNIDATHARVEIGSTWYAARVQRTALNTEAKLLLLTHAFETLGCIAVEFRTHFLNQQSRGAIERLGARLDGILRNHQRARDGTLRDTCVYSITQAEWPAVRSHLTWQLERPR